MRKAVLNNMCQCYINLHLLEDALICCEEALKINEVSVGSLKRKAFLLPFFGRFKEAIKICEQFKFNDELKIVEFM